MDPWEVLGLDQDRATADGVRAARRRLAKILHPDVVAAGGAGEGAVAEASARLAVVNRAVEMAMADLARRGATDVRSPADPSARGDVRMPARSAEDPEARAAGEGAEDATFAVAHLPVDAFELLLLAFSAIGDPKVVDEPYLLEGQIDDPFVGGARVELAPEAGATLVTVTTWPFPRFNTPPPTPAQVAGRLLWEVRALDG